MNKGHSRRKKATRRTGDSPRNARKSEPEQTSGDEHTPSWVKQSVVIFAIALMVRLLHFAAMAGTPIFDVLIGDAWQYDRWGQEIAGGQWIGKEVFYQTPLYPYCLGVVYSILGHHVWGVRIAQALLGSVACALLGRAGSRFFGNATGWVAGLILAFYPPAIFFDGILQKASLDLVLMCGLLWWISRMQSRWTLLGALGLGVILGLLILNRENAWVLFPVLLVWLCWQVWQTWPSPIGSDGGDKRRLPIGSLLPVATFVVGLSLVLVPVGIRNYYVGGEFLLTTSQMGPNFYIGNHRGSEGKYVPLRPDRGDPRFERTDARVLAEEAEGRALSPREVSQYWMRRSREDIVADPAGWLKLLGWKWFLTWSQLELIDGEGIRVHAKYSPVLGRGYLSYLINFGTVTALGIAGVWLSRKRWRELWILVALTMAFALAVALFFVFARYRYPLVPMVVLFAAFGLVRGWQVLRGSEPTKWVELSIAAGLGTVVGIAACWPMSQHHHDEVTYFSVGTGLNDLKRYDEAMEQFKRALDLKPHFAPAYHNMGTAAIAMKDYSQAVSYFSQAVSIAPASATGFSNLGKAQLELGRIREAEQALNRAIELDPLLIQPLMLLSRLETKRGNRAAAVETMKKAVELDRQSVEAYAEYGLVLMADNQLKAAVDAFERTLKLHPTHVMVANNLAWMLATGPDEIRDGKRAVELSTEVDRLVLDENPDFKDTLAASYAEEGDFDRAIEAAEKAYSLLRDQGNPEKSQSILERLTLYHQKLPYRDTSLR